MRSDYSWQCLICGASNGAANGACAQCGFPARATGREIAKAKAEYRSTPARVSQVDLKPESSRERLSDVLSPLSPWRQILAVVGVALAAVGGLTLKIAWSFAALGWGALALAGGFVIGVVAFAGYRPADGNAKRSE